MTTRLDLARELLRRRLALVGVSRDGKDFSRAVLRELLQHGVDVVPVNPALAEADGQRCFARVADVAPPVAAALVMTPPRLACAVVQDCVAGGVRDVWFHQGAGAGAASPEALELCRALGVRALTGVCPFMAVEGTRWFHRAHRFFRGVGRHAAAT